MSERMLRIIRRSFSERMTTYDYRRQPRALDPKEGDIQAEGAKDGSLSSTRLAGTVLENISKHSLSSMLDEEDGHVRH